MLRGGAFFLTTPSTFTTKQYNRPMWQQIKGFFAKKKKTKRPLDTRSSHQLLQTPVQNLVIGMYVAQLDIPWLDSPFPFQGFIIETEKDLQSLKDTCNYVYIDANKQKKIKQGNQIPEHSLPTKPLIFAPPPVRLGSFKSEIIQADKTYKESGVIVANFMDKIANGQGVDSTLAKETVAACVNSILHSPDASLWLTQLKNKDQYTAQHSLNVSILSIVLGRHIGLSEPHLNQVGLCGLMHDMGKMLIPLHILNKPGKLDPDELTIMQSHTTLGYELLKSSDDMYYGAIETALTHHEHMDGHGYPRNIKSEGLSFYSNIVSIADFYDAITSDRVYQKGRTHHEATKIMLDSSGSHLNPELTVKFIESLGAYPPGCFVELSNGSIALVIEENIKFKLRPKILLLLDETKQPTEEVIIDLSDVSSTTPLSIKSIIKPSDFHIDNKKYYQKGYMQKGFKKRK